MRSRSAPTPHVVLASVALVLGFSALFVPSARVEQPGTIPAPLTSLVSDFPDPLPVRDLAGWIQNRRQQLRVVDVRDSAAYQDFHLPTAISVPLRSLTNASWDTLATIVVYGGNPEESVRAWIMLYGGGHTRTRYVLDAVDDWLTLIMNPVFPETDDAETQTHIDSLAALSRYFGGRPRTGIPDDPSETTEALLRSTRRRGCAF